jgi:hypothetical protein
VCLYPFYTLGAPRLKLIRSVTKGAEAVLRKKRTVWQEGADGRSLTCVGFLLTQGAACWFSLARHRTLWLPEWRGYIAVIYRMYGFQVP